MTILNHFVYYTKSEIFGNFEQFCSFKNRCLPWNINYNITRSTRNKHLTDVPELQMKVYISDSPTSPKNFQNLQLLQQSPILNSYQSDSKYYSNWIRCFSLKIHVRNKTIFLPCSKHEYVFEEHLAFQHTERGNVLCIRDNTCGRKRVGKREIKASLLIWSHHRYRVAGTNYVESMYRLIDQREPRTLVRDSEFDQKLSIKSRTLKQ